MPPKEVLLSGQKAQTILLLTISSIIFQNLHPGCVAHLEMYGDWV